MKTIVVVEDNADNRLLLRSLLGDTYHITEYASGAEALAGLSNERPDLVILDISLPGMGGEEVLAHIRADPSLRDLPVIALTAHAMAGDRERLLEAGFDDYLAKPITDEEVLFSAIRARIG
ncbi:MAG TPA: response regulator [Gemmatimonadota bacterium]|nr:response regulator [Gemmatimonadota bacterium]